MPSARDALGVAAALAGLAGASRYLAGGAHPRSELVAAALAVVAASVAVRALSAKPPAAPARAAPSRLDLAPRGAERIVVYGATGRTGVRLVRCALDAGHTVRAFVRSAEKLERVLGTHARLEAAVGDLRDEAAVRAAMKGVSVAVCVAGATEAELGAKHPVGLMPGFARAALEGAKQHGVSRLVLQASCMCAVPAERMPMLVKVLRATAVRALGLEPAVCDSDEVLRVLREHGGAVSWSATLPGGLAERPSQGELETKPAGLLVNGTLSYCDLGRWTLALALSRDEAVERAFVRVGY